ncbi:hypothetical protein HHK36_027533 [Tetracentron sinense]|uniref:Wall-associated receptor kinase galacturonan-binding domain-containing protein n=1 Tax=Tetracentron sinense TaxID=13715 RepID=A0A834YD82_TETSI|nr:hypothetical protein HHK36_027533 [Tetracentron sinense]
MVRRRRRLLSVGFIAIIHALFLVACDAKEDGPCHTYCGNIQNISYPFYLKGDTPNCGDRTFNYELACEDNRTILYLNSSRYYVKEIMYSTSTIRVGDPGVHKDNCSSIPRYSLTNFNFSFFQGAVIGDGTAYPYYLTRQTNYIILMECENPVNSHQYVNTSPCINGSTTTSSLQKHSYAIVGKIVSDLYESCRISLMVPSRLKEVGINYSLSVIHNELASGFELSWSRKDCKDVNVSLQYYDFLDGDNSIGCITFACYYGPSILCAQIPVASYDFYDHILVWISSIISRSTYPGSKKFMWDFVFLRVYDL